MNAFESGARKAVPAVLVYAQLGDQVLMIHKGRPGDYHAGKWNGLGGKCEPDESAMEAARRELREESGLELPRECFRPLGILHFPNFKAHRNEDWIVWVFIARVPREHSSGLVSECAEGKLEWVPRAKLLELNLWAGDREFLPYVVAERPFQGTIWYHHQEVLRSELLPLADMAGEPGPARGAG
ncbi:MAG: 8-oxo-dGTP diphosphatase [Oligoflexia bacterium]|nr:8-oxo-dGTP diphosphatase [Oligoflexia bacterium]